MHIVNLVPEINKGGVENIVCTLNTRLLLNRVLNQQLFHQEEY